MTATEAGTDPAAAIEDMDVDVFVIGGGVNGCGIARDAVGRGYSVALAEMNDLASGTSSWSTKLIHGGLRYLEHYEFRLVREALIEREVLWGNAPHIIWPLRFVLPHHKGLRPAWLLRLGLFLYDNLGGRKHLPPTRTVDLANDEVGKPLKPTFTRAFEYSDCAVDDARLVVLNARDAADRGVAIRTRTEVTSLERTGNGWTVTLRDTRSGAPSTVSAKIVVNAAGPWVDKVLNRAVGKDDATNVRLVQGSHIVVPKLYDHDRCYIFQNADNRIFFAIPYQRDYTLIGTTDRDWKDDPATVTISDEEIAYLCAGASEYFAQDIAPTDIVWTYSGVRPLYDDGASAAQVATRDYVLRTDGKNGKNRDALLINIFGGKITTYRKLAEAVVEKIENALGKRGKPWTHGATLPGGDFPIGGFSDLVADLMRDYPFLSERHAYRLVRQYGTRARVFLGAARSLDDLGMHFGDTLYAAEVAYLIENEWALGADDVLWRRSKLGLKIDAAGAKALDDWIIARTRQAEAAE
ncbi:MAG: glycerol-3-phosphate dehydrogenase [Thalassobaculaceae bacterium]|nr:glycerol-3-phosphate dehydrogenase [Thalassobaculaceae bacterium]